ncbi:heterokaryon incompatibility protein 6, OR allele [Colletotrichum spaethianum]|uniref:Heterokaryon incompatibility protein 6, OR allele n=1 Tax=Colletotrichum spaethianum TaxID=700344 RepID=A0AA37P8R2_9PEZI|nr:heterokaryon incompatibility protein 6, OR allele [Colletotrichum spaethianum]GKT47724.1 heterokaryon incompatibility protein 6, OR allele [Colletotrichum spaethianum]
MREGTLYRYEPLKPRGKEIRVFILYPGLFLDDVVAEIRHVELGRSKYEALSYTWGPANQDHGKIYLQQCALCDSDGLGALPFVNVRSTLLTALRYLRLPTVPRVLWIDSVCVDQENLVERNREVARMGEIYNKAEQVIVWLGPDDDDTPVAMETIKFLSEGVIMEWHRRLFTTVPGSEADLLRTRSDQSTLTLAQWTALRSLLTRPWFTRLWVRQEVALASRVVVVCGGFQAAWEDVEKVAILLEHSSTRVHIRLRDILFVRSLFQFQGSDELSYILHRSSFCGYSDASDLVYANLSTSSAIKALRVEPNYDMSVAAVYKDLTIQYMQHFGNLDILRSCGSRDLPPDFESFVPDFAVAKSESRLVNEYAHGGTRHLPVIAEGGITLKLEGKYIGKVSHVSKFRRPLATGYADRDKIIDIIMTYRRWEPADLFTAPYPTGGTLFDAFIALLAGGSYREVYGGPHYPTKEEAKEAFLAVVWSGGHADMVAESRFWGYIGEITSDRRGEHYFRTREGHVGTTPGDVQTGDIICRWERHKTGATSSWDLATSRVSCLEKRCLGRFQNHGYA